MTASPAIPENQPISSHRLRHPVLSVMLQIGIVSLIGGAIISQPVLAQDDQVNVVGSSAISYVVPAGSLHQALDSFARRAGVNLTYDAALLEGLTTQGINGRFTTSEALERLLADSNLQAISQSAGGYRLTQKNSVDSTSLTLPTVKVSATTIDGLPEAYAGGQVARGGRVGILGNKDMMDTPFSQTSYTAELIENQQARTIADVALNDPSVQASWPSSGYTSPLMIRGFAVSNQDVAFNGLYGVAPTFDVDVDMAERIEILKGPNAMLSGMQPSGSVGGSVNIVPKRAGSEPLTRVSANYISDSQLGAQLDVGRRFGEAQQFGVRFNGSMMDGDANIDDQSRQLGSAVLGMDYQGENWRASLDMGYQQQQVDAPILITFLGSGLEVPSAPDSSSNWFLPWSWVDIDDSFGAVRAEYDLNDNWTVYGAAGLKDTNWERLTYFPRITNNAGDITGTPAHLKYRYLTDTQEVGLKGAFGTGSVDHELFLSVTRFRQRTNGLSVSAGGAIASNLYQPVDGIEPWIGYLDPPRTADSHLNSVAIGDVLSVLDDRLQFILGLRHQRIDTNNYSATTRIRTSHYTDSALSPSIGIIAKPWGENISLYANYIEGLQQGTTVGNTYANGGETLEPYTSEQHEMGVKVDWGSLATTLSAFQITQPSGIANTSNVFEADGEQRNRGLELNLFGNVTDNVRLLGGVTLMDAELTKTNGGLYDGNRATGVPRIKATLGAEWDTGFMPGMTLLGRVVHTGSQEVDQANTQDIPSWNRVDIGLRYVFNQQSKPVTFRANIENLLDQDDWTSSAYFPGYLTPSSPRTLLMSVSVDL